MAERNIEMSAELGKELGLTLKAAAADAILLFGPLYHTQMKTGIGALFVLAGAQKLELWTRGFGDKSLKPFLLLHDTRSSRDFTWFFE